ncbi:RmlD-like substrate binding domain-containing protein [Umbelopsis sp. AD052]|nr:RmlD-like substrate binding domain-containing protein [Umbelopsis sp. AD052]
MRVLVTGASGLLGRAVYQNFKKNGHEVIGTAHSRANGDLVKLDLTLESNVKQFVDAHKPDAIIHCAAERRPDVAEKDQTGTEFLNVQVPKDIAKISKANGIFLIYISTDYVFDGTQPPYHAIGGEPNPLNFYGKTKLAGEKAIQEVYPEATILRVPILYGKTEYNGESAVNTLVDVVMNQSKPSKMDDVAVRYPTNVEDVARVLVDLTSAKLEQGKDIHGVYHFSSEKSYTKYAMCQTFAKALHVPLEHVEPVDTSNDAGSASRPKDAHLSNDRLEQSGISTFNVDFDTWWNRHIKPSK